MKPEKDSLGNRMKSYENIPRIHLTPRTPLIIRLDGCHFHTYTRGLDKPFDPTMHKAMTEAAKTLIKNISGAKVAYIQSDEISILINDYETFSTQAWFDKSLQKIVSVSASIATAAFNHAMLQLNKAHKKIATFDSRAFVLPKEEVNNYFVWRQKDAIRNGISSLAQKHFSHKELHKKNQAEMVQMLADKGIHRGPMPTWQKVGWCVKFCKGDGIKEDFEIPEFSLNHNYIGDHLLAIEE
jgi:tRNA(His) 5'-end guanylyltransferase